MLKCILYLQKVDLSPPGKEFTLAQEVINVDFSRVMGKGGYLTEIGKSLQNQVYLSIINDFLQCMTDRDEH